MIIDLHIRYLIAKNLGFKIIKRKKHKKILKRKIIIKKYFGDFLKKYNQFLCKDFKT